MIIKDILQDYALQELEHLIMMAYTDPIDRPYDRFHSFRDEASLLQARRDIINFNVLQNQEELLPDIIAFNDSLREALRTMYDKAKEVYEANKDFGRNVSVEACCYFSKEYPPLHPLQEDDRQELWEALLDPGWNYLYDTGVTFPFQVKWNSHEAFDEFIESNCPPPDWYELTEDLHMLGAFQHLEVTDFAITDFIYCRKFIHEIKVTIPE